MNVFIRWLSAAGNAQDLHNCVWRLNASISVGIEQEGSSTSSLLTAAD